MQILFLLLSLSIGLSACTFHTKEFSSFSSSNKESKVPEPNQKLSNTELGKQKNFKDAANIDFRIEINGLLSEAEKKKANDELIAYIKETFSAKSGSLRLLIETKDQNAKLQINFVSNQNNLSFNSSSSNIFGFDNTEQLIQKSKKSLNDLLSSIPNPPPGDRSPKMNNSGIDQLFDKRKRLNQPASPIKNFETSPNKGSWI